MNWMTLPVAVVMMSVAPASGEPWSRFRGPNGTGMNGVASFPIRWTEKDYNWKARVPGAGHSSPVVVERRLYLTSADPQSARRMVLCLDTVDGHVLWVREYPSQPYRQHGDNNYASATPAADVHGVVVAWTTPDRVLLLALTPEGHELWRRDLGPFVGERGSGQSPILVDDMVVMANDQEDPSQLPENRGKADFRVVAGKSFLIAVDRMTGRTRWQIERRSGIAPYATPCLNEYGGQREIVFLSASHGLTAVDPSTGRITWELAEPFRDRCVASPVVAPGLVMAGYGLGLRGDRFVAVRPGSRAKGIAPSVAYDLTKSVPLVPTPIVKGDRLFLWCDDGVVSCLKVATGETVWRERAGGAFYSSPVCVGDRLYGVAKNGQVVVLSATDHFEVLSRHDLGEPSFATPAVADGVMYFRTKSHLISLGTKTR